MSSGGISSGCRCWATISKDQPAVKYVEFWNEPDLDFFQGTMADYQKMFAFHAHGPLGNYVERQELVEQWRGGVRAQTATVEKHASRIQVASEELRLAVPARTIPREGLPTVVSA
ncbi:MAG: hypothetical protein WC789_02095 [Lentisphaeria bacterium]